MALDKHEAHALKQYSINLEGVQENLKDMVHVNPQLAGVFLRDKRIIQEVRDFIDGMVEEVL